MKKITIMLFLLTMSLFTLFAQTRALSLDESIDLAKKNNKELQKAREQVDIYRQDYNNVKGSLLPQITLSGGYEYKKTNMPESAIVDYSFLTDNLETGATVNDSMIAGYIDAFIPAFLPEEEKEEHSLSAGLELNQVVFMGGKLINGINIAGKLYHLEEKRYQLEEKEIVLEAKEKYFLTILASEALEIQEAALSLAMKYQKQVNDMYDQGLVSEYNLLRAQLEVEKLKPAVMEADKRYVLALEILVNFLDLESNDINLTDPIQLIDTQDLVYENAVNIGLSKRMELELSDIAVDVSKVNLRYEKGNFLPNIGLTAKYNYFGQDTKEIESNDWGHFYSVGVGFSMPLFTGFSNSAKIKKARHQLKQSELSRFQLLENIELDITNNFKTWEVDSEKYKSQQRNVELAERSLTIAEARFNNQVSNQLELIDAQLQVKIARLELLNATYAARISYEKLLKAIGR